MNQRGIVGVQFAFLLLVQFNRLNQLRHEIADVLRIGDDLVLVMFDALKDKLEITGRRFDFRVEDFHRCRTDGPVRRMQAVGEDQNRQGAVFDSRCFLEQILEETLLLVVPIGEREKVLGEEQNELVR